MMTIRSEKDIVKAVRHYGFLPFFKSAIPGLSVEEMADSSVWFPPKGEGVWEWKDPVIKETGAAYGKFFLSRPGFVSSELFPVLAAYRRDGYDVEGMINISSTESKYVEIIIRHTEYWIADEDFHDDILLRVFNSKGWSSLWMGNRPLRASRDCI